MKTELQIIEGNMIITSIDSRFSITLDVQTGEVLEFGYTRANISEMRQFIQKARARYSKFLSSDAIGEFID